MVTYDIDAPHDGTYYETGKAGDPLHFPAEDQLKATDTMQQTIEDARKASENERNMTLMQGLKLYPKAAAWSVLISTCIAMEGFQVRSFPSRQRMTRTNDLSGRPRQQLLRFRCLQPEVRRPTRRRHLSNSGAMASRTQQRSQRRPNDRTDDQRLRQRTVRL